ncbi:MAG: methylmalonyl-CoA mutase family protein [Candidatus Sulfomarinibacteraceae bacterium]
MASSDSTFRDFPALGGLFDPPTLDDWRRAAESSLRGRPLDRLTVRTHEGLAVHPLYTEADAAGDPGLPGRAPHVRGRTAMGPGASSWTVCQAVAHPEPVAAAGWAAEDVAGGARAVWLIFDRSVRTAAAETREPEGDGVGIFSANGFDPLLERLDPSRTDLHLDAGGNAPAVAAALVSAARRHGIDPSSISGSIGFDPLGALAADGALTAGLDGSTALMAGLVRWAENHAPRLRSIAVSTVAHHLAGANAVQELAYALATAVAYLRGLAEHGVEPRDATRQMLFRFAVGRDLFMEAAKLRAYRRLWSRAADVCGAGDDGRAATIHAIAAPRGLTTRDPWVNMLRTTVGGFAAVVGGADLITIQPFDQAIGLSDRLARRMARNTQTILREESHLGRVVDPGGGSWYLEWLTDELAQAAWERFQAIETNGGMASLLCDGTIATQLDRLQADREEAFATRRDPITGVSSFPNLAEDRIDRERPEMPRPVIAGGATEDLARLFKAASDSQGDGELIEAAVAAAAAGAGIGQLAVALRGARSETAVTRLSARREAEIFERLRDASDAWLAATGARPRIFLANMGPIPEHKPRATFAANFFEAGGIEALGNDGFDTTDGALDAFESAGTQMAVICSSDTRYPDVVPDLAAGLEKRGARTVLVAGKPGEHETAWRESGVTGFIHMGCDQVRLLLDLLQEEGVLHV